MRRREFIAGLGVAGAWPFAAWAQQVAAPLPGLDSSAGGTLPNPPTGSPQHPNLLNPSSASNGLGYNLATRPPWQVAGVDYYVGIDRAAYPSNADLKDPSVQANLPVGATVSGATVRLSGSSNTTLEGFDFSLHGGMQVNMDDYAHTLTVSNCNFAVGSNLLRPIEARRPPPGRLVLTRCIIDGGGAQGGVGFTDSVGELVYQVLFDATYVWMKNAMADGFRPDSCTGSVSIKYCLFENAAFNTRAHADWLQLFSEPGGCHWDDCVLSFNTCLQTNAGRNNLNAFLRLNMQVNNPTISYNTCVATSDANVNYWIEIVEGDGDQPSSIVHPVSQYNYMLPDPHDQHYSWSGAVSSYPGGIVNPTINNNVNLLTGEVDKPWSQIRR
jgi:hypothetical protein